MWESTGRPRVHAMQENEIVENCVLIERFKIGSRDRCFIASYWTLGFNKFGQYLDLLKSCKTHFCFMLLLLFQKNLHESAGRSNISSSQQTSLGNGTPLGFTATSPAPPLPPRGLSSSSVAQPPGSSARTVQGKAFNSGESCVMPLWSLHTDFRFSIRWCWEKLDSKRFGAAGKFVDFTVGNDLHVWRTVVLYPHWNHLYQCTFKWVGLNGTFPK
jgi:hypothetical protein